MEKTLELVNYSQISATEPDWSREQLHRWWDPPRQLLKSIREYQHWKAHDSFNKSF